MKDSFSIPIIAGQAWWPEEDIIKSDLKLKWKNKYKPKENKYKPKEVLSVHDVQGLDYDYVVVIVGPDLIYDGKNVKAVPKEHKSKWMEGSTPEDVDTYIKRIYKVLLTRGTKGCYVYCCDSNLNQRFKNSIPASQDK